MIVNAARQLADEAPHHLRDRFRGVRADGPFRWHFVAHHLAGRQCLPCISVRGAAVMTLDGRGEKATTGYAIGQGTDLEWLGQVHMPHSLGLLYEEVTDYLGFLRSSDEYKVMALASYGKPHYVGAFREIVELGSGGQYTIGPLRLDSSRTVSTAYRLQVMATFLRTSIYWIAGKPGSSSKARGPFGATRRPILLVEGEAPFA